MADEKARFRFNPKRLKAERIASGASQEEIAKALYWSRGRYIRVESGKGAIGCDDLAVFAEYLGVKNMNLFFIQNVDELEQS